MCIRLHSGTFGMSPDFEGIQSKMLGRPNPLRLSGSIIRGRLAAPPENEMAPCGAILFSRRVRLRMRTLFDSHSAAGACEHATPKAESESQSEFGFLVVYPSTEKLLSSLISRLRE